MNRFIPLLACASVLIVCMGMAEDDPNAASEQQAQPSFWMKKKLEYSNEILAGLTDQNFEQVRKNAKAMNALGHIENWVHASRPGYRTQLAIFRHANEQLIAEADENDLDGATLAYVQLTLSCVSCHKVVRDAKTKNPQP